MKEGCVVLCLIAAAIGLFTIGPCVGRKAAEVQMMERDKMDAATKAEMERLLKEREAAQKSE